MSWTLYVYDEDIEEYLPDDEGLADQDFGALPSDKSEAIEIVSEIMGKNYPDVKWQLRAE
jgi:hypothetical protein